MVPTARSSVLRSSIGILVLIILVPAILFAAAGTLAWPMGWAYVALATAGTGVTHLLVARRNPDTLQERARGFRAEGIQRWDRRLLPTVIWSSVLILIVAGLDHRLGWSGVAVMRVQEAALVPAVAGYVLTGWAMVENRFFSGTVRIQADRGHVVVSSGPYRLVRHPGYAGSILATIFVPVILGSWWAFLPAGVAVAGLVARTALEDRMLRRELNGYEAFASRTRWRLFPGVW
jgi:protein-S-isoprenylcysteine O-methyltransferase Ste14